MADFRLDCAIEEALFFVSGSHFSSTLEGKANLLTSLRSFFLMAQHFFEKICKRKILERNDPLKKKFINIRK